MFTRNVLSIDPGSTTRQIVQEIRLSVGIATPNAEIWVVDEDGA
jgi:hypothetical protein